VQQGPWVLQDPLVQEVKWDLLVHLELDRVETKEIKDLKDLLVELVK
jgi:hypothetical protein